MLEQIFKYGVVCYDLAVRLSALFEEQDKELQTVFYWGVIGKPTLKILEMVGKEVGDIGLCIEINPRRYALLMEDDYFPLLIEDYEALYPAPTVQELMPHLPPFIVNHNGMPKNLNLQHATGAISKLSARLLYGNNEVDCALLVPVVTGALADAYGNMYCKLAEYFKQTPKNKNLLNFMEANKINIESAEVLYNEEYQGNPEEKQRQVVWSAADLESPLIVYPTASQSLHRYLYGDTTTDLELLFDSGHEHIVADRLTQEQAIKIMNVIQDYLRFCPEKFGKQPIDIDQIVNMVKTDIPA